MKLCGSSGHKAKDGRPCGYRIAETADSCPHHAPGGSKAKDFQAKGLMASKFKRVPANVDVTGLETADAILGILAQVAVTAAKDPNPDLKRLDVIIRACNGANAVLQTKAIKELNDTIMRTEGHGPAFLLLERFKTGSSRPLPGTRGLIASEGHPA